MELWAFDEHRAGLKPVLRRVWAKRGRRPIAPAEPRYEWLYLYGFVRPTTGALVWFLCNGVNTALFAAVLARFAGAPPRRVRRPSYSTTCRRNHLGTVFRMR